MIPKNYDPAKHPVIEYWQDKEKNPHIVHHRDITRKMVELEKYWMVDYQVERLLKAIENYNYVMSGHTPETYLGQYVHKFEEFFRKGAKKPPPFVKFIPEEGYNPRQRLLKSNNCFQNDIPKEHGVIIDD